MTMNLYQYNCVDIQYVQVFRSLYTYISVTSDLEESEREPRTGPGIPELQGHNIIQLQALAEN